MKQIRIRMKNKGWLYLDHIQGKEWREHESGARVLFDTQETFREWEYVTENNQQASVQTNPGAGRNQEQEETGAVHS